METPDLTMAAFCWPAPGIGWFTLTPDAQQPRRATLTHEQARTPQRDGPSPVEVELRACFLQGLGGDAGAYREFLDQLSSHLRAYLRRRLPRAQADVEDILQETLLAVHNARHTYRDDQPLTAWVYAVTRYKLMDFFRAHARREALHDPIDSRDDLFVASDTEQSHAQRDVGKLLETLPQRHRLPIELVKLQGLSVAEAAQRSGLSESAVKVGIHRGLKALAARIRGVA